MNRNFVYFVRKHLPDNQALHNKLAEIKLKSFRASLIPMDDVDKGEENPALIPEIIEKYKVERPAQMRSLVSSFQKYLHDAGIEYSDDEYDYQLNRTLFDCLAYGFAPDEVVFYRLREKSLEEKRNYVTNLDRTMMQYIMSDFKELQFVFDKIATYQRFRKYYARDEIGISKPSDFDLFHAFAQKHDAFVIKQVSNSCGKGVALEETDLKHLREQFDRILALGRCSIEERIVQSSVLNSFNESSVNTARVMTFQTKDGPVVGPCFFRSGRKGSFVDNVDGGAGGILTGIDRKTGVLDTDGHDEYLHLYKTHPDSGVAFSGFQLPEWDRCIEMVHEMCALIPKVGYIGWDLAHSEHGWVVVEANGGSHMVNQLVYGQGCKQEVEGYINSRVDLGVDLEHILSDGCYRSFT